MSQAEVKTIVELIAASMLPLGFVGVMIHRLVLNKSIGARVVQLTAVVMLIPVILVLALERILDAATISALIGGIVGHLLSGISEYDKARGANNP